MEEKIDITNNILEEKSKKIKQLNSDVKELTELFKDLDELVNIQNNSVENIVDNIKVTKEKTKIAVKELEYAKEHKSKYFWAKTATVGIVAVVAGIPLSSVVGIKVASSIACGSVITSLFL